MTEKQTPETNGEEEAKTPFDEFLQHQRRALEETGKALEALLPEGFRKHGNEASKEFTQGFRVLVDAAMNELKKGRKFVDVDESDDDDNTSTTGKKKVKVQVD